jgi:hypothetical protein
MPDPRGAPSPHENSLPHNPVSLTALFIPLRFSMMIPQRDLFLKKGEPLFKKLRKKIILY